jgi:hypothetical protein
MLRRDVITLFCAALFAGGGSVEIPELLELSANPHHTIP